MKPIRLTIYRRQEAEALLKYLSDGRWASLTGQLRRALKSTRLQPVSINGVSVKFTSDAPAKKAQKLAAKAAETAYLWRLAMARSGGQCECGCGQVFQEEGDLKPEMDHGRGRRVPQRLDEVWMLIALHHRQRTGNSPSERYWLEQKHAHALKHGYFAEAKRIEDRLVVVDTKSGFRAKLGRRTT